MLIMTINKQLIYIKFSCAASQQTMKNPTNETIIFSDFKAETQAQSITHIFEREIKFK